MDYFFQKKTKEFFIMFCELMCGSYFGPEVDLKKESAAFILLGKTKLKSENVHGTCEIQ